MNCILNKDETSIECISDGDMVIIIENNYYNDDTFLSFLKNQKGSKINVNLEISNGWKKNIIVPKNTKCSQLYKALLLNFGLRFDFRYNSEAIEENDNRILTNFIVITIYDRCDILPGLKIYGKEIKSKVIVESFSKNGEKRIINVSVGTLNSFKLFLIYFENQICKKVEKFYIEKKEIKIDGEDKSFSSLGINHDFECQMVFEKHKYN